MKYIIYEVISPEHLQKTVLDGYYNKTLYRSILQPVDNEHGMVESEHDSMDAAIEEIKKHKEELKYCTLTILPIVKINYEGEVS
jgi:hypothetical protein